MASFLTSPLGSRATARAISAAAVLQAICGRATAEPPTVVKVERDAPGHDYSLVATHGVIPAGFNHFDTVVAAPNAIWTNRLSLIHPAAPMNTPTMVSFQDVVTHNRAPHGEVFPWGPYLVAGAPVFPPLGGVGFSVGFTAGAQNHPIHVPPHNDISNGVLIATYLGFSDFRVNNVLYLEVGRHDPPGCACRVAPCTPADVVPASGSTALGAAGVSIELSDNNYGVTIAVRGVSPAQVLSANIHQGQRGTNGPAIVAVPGPWQAVTADVSTVTFHGFFPAQYAADLMAGRTYVQVNTTAFPSGAVRGQLIAAPVYSNSGDLMDPFRVTRTGGQCSVNGNASDVQTSLGLSDHGFGCGAAANDAVADDFVVPAGQAWKIDGFTLQLYQTGAGSPTITSIDYAFSDSDLLGQSQPAWTTVAVSPGMTKTFRKLSTDGATAGCDRRIQEMYVPLVQDYTASAGRHWLTWRATGSGALPAPQQMPVVVPGQVQSAGANALRSIGGQPYAYIVDTGNQTQQDLVFSIAGYPLPKRVEPGDIVVGLGKGSNVGPPTQQQLDDTVQLYSASGVQRSDSWNQFQFAQSMEWDNFLGVPHNPNGFLFGLDFGSVATGGRIYRYQSGLGWTGAAVFNDVAGQVPGFASLGLSVSRCAGLSVSPDNTKLAMGGYDSGQVVVLDFDDINGVVTGGRQSSGGILTTGDSPGTCWLNDSTVVGFGSSGQLWTVNATTMSPQLQIDVGAGVGGSEFCSLAYRQSVGPYVYCGYSSFVTPTTINRLYIVDPRQNPWVVVREVDLSVSANSLREIALADSGDLYFTTFGDTVSLPKIQKLSGVTNPASLTDNSSVVIGQLSTFASFSGIDVAAGSVASVCYANCDGSTSNPRLTANDFQCFLDKFAANESYANCDGSTGSPSLTANDFQCFLNKFAAGCV